MENNEMKMSKCFVRNYQNEGDIEVQAPTILVQDYIRTKRRASTLNERVRILKNNLALAIAEAKKRGLSDSEWTNLSYREEPRFDE